jgi:dihydrofolate reductase
MRKVVLIMAVSLDGYVGRPDGDVSWIFPNVDSAVLGWVSDAIRRTDTQLLGRVSYQEQAQHWPTATDDLAPLINGAQKIVFSSTLDTVDEWQNSRLAKADPAEEIADLKRSAGKDIFVPGGARFVQSLSRQGLIDEYRIAVHPVVLGAGLPLFTDEVKLTLVSSRAFDTGVLGLVYRPAS